MNATVKSITAGQVLFNVLFPEHSMFRSHMSAEASHCIMRAGLHISGKGTGNTYPSTKDGELLPFIVKVSD